MAQGSTSTASGLLKILNSAVPSAIVSRLIGYMLTNNRLDNIFDWLLHGSVTPLQVVLFVVFTLILFLLFNSKKLAQWREDRSEVKTIRQLESLVGTVKHIPDPQNKIRVEVKYKIVPSYLGYGYTSTAHQFICTEHRLTLDRLGCCPEPSCFLYHNPVKTHLAINEIDTQISDAYDQIRKH